MNTIPILELSLLSDPKDKEKCANLMCTSEPWVTLKRTYAESLKIFELEENETYGAYWNNDLIGFAIIEMTGALRGFVRSIAMAPEHRGKGLGSALLSEVEKVIKARHSNVFLCVSSFNEKAQKFYKNMGYDQVGVLTNYVVEGHDEILMRKSFGPLTEFNNSK